MTTNRGNFGSKLAIVLATAGSAVGLGNVWRFPFMTGQNGGAAFILIYFACVLLLGIPGMVSEFIVGRHSQANAARAYGSMGHRGWRWIGYLGILTSTIILGFYAVVAGWCLQYLFASLGGRLNGDATYVIDYFTRFSSDPVKPCLWAVGFVLITHAVVAQGVEKGIERASKLLMPLLLLLLVILVVASCMLPGVDQSGVDNVHMAIIRDAFPNIKVVWRVWFSTLDYSCRTDAKTILCSLAGDAGLTDEESCRPLTYCTEVVNLDVGHNNNMRTLSFLKYMPNLEIFITYNNYLRDVDDLAYCKKLRYVELFGSSMYNINSIAELTELTDLQIGGCYNLTDISPIIPADRVPKIRRLWLTPGYIPQEQIDAFKQNHPYCEINDTDDSVGYYWRFIDPIHTFNTEENRTPAYREIVNIFHYGAEDNSNYSFSKNDPYYTAAHGEPVGGERVRWFYG